MSDKETRVADMPVSGAKKEITPTDKTQLQIETPTYHLYILKVNKIVF